MLPKLKQIFDESKKDEEIDKDWLKSLANCIQFIELEEK